MSHATNTRPPTAIDSASNTYRVVILDGNGTKVRVVLDSDRHALPSVSVPHWQRIAENLTDAVKNEWAEEVICLFSPNDLGSDDNSRFSYEVTEHRSTKGTPRLPMRWERVSDISQDSFPDQCDYMAIVQGAATCKGERQNQTGPFTRLGWFRNLREWVKSAIEPYGLKLNESFRQLNASPWFSLVRFETNRSAVWFKAVGEPNQKELPITCVLAELLPSYLPRVLGVRPDWNGWLAQETEGTNLGETWNIAPWERAANDLAKLQIESIGSSFPILTAGARDQRANALSHQIRPFIDAMTRLMGEQSSVPPAILNEKELRRLGDRIRDALDLLARLGVPDAVGHSDLNPGNVLVAHQSCKFLDWAEAHIGNPFFSFQYLLEHFRRVRGPDSAKETRLIESYGRPWRRVVSSTAIIELLALVPLLAVFAYAVGSAAWTNEQQFRERTTAAYLRSLTRRMNRESIQLSGKKT